MGPFISVDCIAYHNFTGSWKKTLHTEKKAYFNPGPKEIDLKDVERLTFDIRDRASIVQTFLRGVGPSQKCFSCFCG